MIATYVPDVVTTLSRSEVVDPFRWALGAAGQDTRVLALALAKSALETGRWKAIHLHNFGNVKAGDQYQGMYTCFRCNEVIDGKVRWFDPTGAITLPGGQIIGATYPVPPGHPQTRFRAYPNRYDGALAYVEFIQGPRYRSAWEALLTGDAHAFVHALKAARYFTADEAPYARAVASLQREFLGVIGGQEPEPFDVALDELRLLLVRAEEQWINIPGWDGRPTPGDFLDEDTDPDPPKTPRNV